MEKTNERNNKPQNPWYSRERERESGNLNKLNIKEKARQKAYINIGFLSCFFNVYKKIDFYPEHMWIFCIKQ